MADLTRDESNKLARGTAGDGRSQGKARRAAEPRHGAAGKATQGAASARVEERAAARKRNGTGACGAQAGTHDCERLAARCAELEQRAEAAEQMLREMASSTAHDLRNSMSVIRVSLRMLQRPLGPEAAGRKHIDAIGRAADDVCQLAQNLVDATNIEGGTLTVGHDPQEVKPLVDRAIEAVAMMAAAKSIALETKLPEGLPPVRGDRARLVQILTGLLESAMRFTPPGGRVTLRVEQAGADTRFAVSDTGPGIDPGVRRLLFARRAPARQPAGQGVGLAAFVAKGIVEAHAGKIWAESEVGRGSTFFFTVPTAAPA